jgi:DNA repair exonuclease SbcCD ATPase subunit
MKLDDLSMQKWLELVSDDSALQAKIGALKEAAIVSRDEAKRADQAVARLKAYEEQLKTLDGRIQASLADLARREQQLQADRAEAAAMIARGNDMRERILEAQTKMRVAMKPTPANA